MEDRGLASAGTGPLARTLRVLALGHVALLVQENRSRDPGIKLWDEYGGKVAESPVAEMPL
jgi:hypothetical protein